MNRSKQLVASALIALSLLAVALVATSSDGNAGAMNAAERVEGAFALLNLDSATQRSVRMIAEGYQTDGTASLLLRSPGL